MPTPTPRPPRRSTSPVRNPGQRQWDQRINRSSRPNYANQLHDQESDGSDASYAKSSGSGGYDFVNSMNSFGGRSSGGSSGSGIPGTPTTYSTPDTESRDVAPENDATDDTREQEENPSGSWANNTTPAGDDTAKDGKTKNSKFGKVAGKGGPIGLIMFLLLALASAVSFFGGPGLMIVHITEVITQKFSLPLASVMENRSTKIISAKLKNTTTGVCTPVKVRCKYATFSEREMKKLKKAGIEFEGKTRKFGKWSKPEKLKWTDKAGKTTTITPENFKRMVKDMPEFAEALHTAYNPRFSSLSNNIFNKLLSKFKASKSKSKALDEKDKNKATEEINKEVKEGKKTTKANTGKNSDDPNYKGDDPDGCDDSCKRKNDVSNDLNQAADGTDSEASKIAKGAGKRGLKTAVGALKLTGAIDDACSVYGMYKAVSLGVKVIRNLQLIRLAIMLTLTTGSMIKAMNEFDNGHSSDTLTPDNVALVGTLWTQTMRHTEKDDKGNDVVTTTKSGIESFGFRYAAYGDSGIDDAASLFTNGGSFGGSTFGKVNDAIQAITDGIGGRKAANKTCKINNNMFVQGAVLVASIAVMLLPGAGQAIKATTLVTQGGLQIALQAAQMILPGILADILSGAIIPTKFDDLAGEVMGNATVSGAGALMSSNGRQSLAPLTASQAQANKPFYDRYQQQYAREQRATHSPFDATSRYTFLGSIYSQFMPTFAKIQTGRLSDIFSAFGKLATAPSRIFSSKAHAATGETYDTCKDAEYRDLNLATDPFCNVIYGTDDSTEPDELINSLSSSGEVDDEGKPTGKFAEWTKRCNESDTPIGSTGEDSTESDGSECLLGNGKNSGRYATYKVDQLILDSMENGDNENNSAGSTNTGASGSLPTGDAKSLAQQILDNPNITVSEGEWNSGNSPKDQLTNTAKGLPALPTPIATQYDRNIDPRILQLILFVAQKHKITITSLLRTTMTAGGWSLHPRGKAVDLSPIGTCGTGGEDECLQAIQEILDANLLPAGGGFGQQYCGNRGSMDAAIMSKGLNTFDDTCSHLHIDLGHGS
mgnify:CR=1 FL=1